MSKFSGINEPEKWLLPAMLREQAEQQADAPWLAVAGGPTLSFGQAWTEVQRAATWFERSGVTPGEHVALMLPNSVDFVRAWLALGTLGAVAVLINTELKRDFLQHQLKNSGARLLLCHSSLVQTIEEALPGAPNIEMVVLCDAYSPSHHLSSYVQPFAPWFGASGWQCCPAVDRDLPDSRQISSVIYTSGTSGPAKGVLMPHRHCAAFAINTSESMALTGEDRCYIVLPLFHAHGLLMQLGASLVQGLAAVMRERFSASAWLEDIRRYRITATSVLGALGAFIEAQPQTPNDKNHSLRVLFNAPNVSAIDRLFRERFGVRDIVSGYGMTEVNMCALGRCGSPRPGAAGWILHDMFDVAVVDPLTDCELPHGQVGEIVVRPKIPFVFMQGYQGMPERTAEATRNLWFHTGDSGVADADGLLTFIDRIKDTIRRRGENISATEIEQVLAKLPGVAEVAAYAVPSPIPGGEDEVVLALVRANGPEGETLDSKAVYDFADKNLPRFARPRYLRFISELPKTANGKVQRAVLRKDGTRSANDRGELSRVSSD